MPMNEKAWEKRRRMGFFGFVMVWGVGFWGLTSGVLFALAWTVTGQTASLQRGWGAWGLVGFWLACVAGFAGGGFWWGAVMWWLSEAMYKRQVRASGREPAPPGMSEDHDRA